MSLTRACAGTKGSAQVVIHKVVGLASDSLAQGVGHCLSQVCDEIRSMVITWMSSHWEEVVDYGPGEVSSLRNVFNRQYPSPEGGKLFVEGRDGYKEVVVKEFGQWAKLMRLVTTYPDFLFRCAVALSFNVQLIIQHLELTKDETKDEYLEPYISPVGPTRQVFLFWEELDENWYWGHEVEDRCLEGCGGKPRARKVVFTAPEINTSGDKVSGSGGQRGKKQRAIPSIPGRLNQLSGPFVTYVRARGYPRPPYSMPVKGACCEADVWVHSCVGGEAESFFESVAGALNDYNACSSMPLKTTFTQKSIKRDVRAFIDENKVGLAEHLKEVYDDIPEAGMVMRALVEGSGLDEFRSKPRDLQYWVEFNMGGQYHHDNLWFSVVANCFNIQFIVVNECGMHPVRII